VIESSAIIDVTFQPHEHVDVHQLFISIKKERCFVPNETRKRVWKPGNTNTIKPWLKRNSLLRYTRVEQQLSWVSLHQ